VGRVDDLRQDYDRLGKILEGETDGAKASSLARERRMIGELLDALEAPAEVTKVDELAARRTDAGAAGAASGRRKSRRG
jgi:hypothetical protein